MTRLTADKQARLQRYDVSQHPPPVDGFAAIEHPRIKDRRPRRTEDEGVGRELTESHIAAEENSARVAARREAIEEAAIALADEGVAIALTVGNPVARDDGLGRGGGGEADAERGDGSKFVQVHFLIRDGGQGGVLHSGSAIFVGRAFVFREAHIQEVGLPRVPFAPAPFEPSHVDTAKFILVPDL